MFFSGVTARKGGLGNGETDDVAYHNRKHFYFNTNNGFK
jgi:hypothetical protein